jgi:DEAD/DEAH box helicase domain-containing protein
MFGMPTTVKNLYHGIKSFHGNIEILSIDRPQVTAIYEFAPGAQMLRKQKIKLFTK